MAKTSGGFGGKRCQRIFCNGLRAWEPALLQNHDLLKLDLGDLDLGEGKRLARRAVELIEQGTVGYTLIAASVKRERED